MRVVGGRARGHPLKRVPGDTTRPIMDRVKENLFNIIGQDVTGSVWLDMFAGTGAVGIEALSRGATAAVFLDLARLAVRTIHDNLRSTRLQEGATVLRADALAYGREYTGVPFDYLYIAPPQYRGLWRDALVIVDACVDALVAPYGQVIVQIDPKEYEPQALGSLVLADQRTYGSTMLCFYERDGADEEE
jgi:16S rRNA (guanine(966)-N(2))-methyltransferase RsmD